MSKVKKYVRRVFPKKTVKNVENFYRKHKARVANAVYGFPSKKMKVIAITGTNGKTSTATYLNEIIKSGGYKTAVFTTAFIEIDSKNEFNKSHMTVPSAWAVQSFMARAKKAKIDWVILEVTSHALDQFRILGVPIEIALITNLSQDHLDYHGTMKNYALAKSKLLTDFNPKRAILNADDDWAVFFEEKARCPVITIGQGKAYHQIKELKLTPKGSSFTLISPYNALKIKTALVGEFNVYNAAMAAVCGLEAEIGLEPIAKGIAEVKFVPGRMEQVNAGQDFSVLVDYAVTPDALEKALVSLKKITTGRVRVVFGATGDRDKSKRPIMGEVAAKNADYIYLTDDETYTENGNLIRNAVKKGIMAAGAQYKFIEIADRREAIRQAFADAKHGDCVLLAGIGHEDYRNMGGKKEPWDERVVAREILKEIKSK
jgi:UDP-N-acetylmuramoyl-L-alanyl-D-glutamate--2,6-diaminopimelate ligase